MSESTINQSNYLKIWTRFTQFHTNMLSFAGTDFALGVHAAGVGADFTFELVFLWCCQSRVMVTKALSAANNEGNAEGMLSSLGRNVSLCASHNTRFSPSPPTTKNDIPHWNTRWCFVWGSHYILSPLIYPGLISYVQFYITFKA